MSWNELGDGTVVNTSWFRKLWQHSNTVCVVGNNVPISLYDGCDLFAHVWERGYNGENFGFCVWCSLGKQVITAVGQRFFYAIMMRCSGYARYLPACTHCVLGCWDDHVVTKCLGIDDTFFAARWMVRMEVKKCHAVGWFSIEFRFRFSGLKYKFARVGRWQFVWNRWMCIWCLGWLYSWMSSRS